MLKLSQQTDWDYRNRTTNKFTNGRCRNWIASHDIEISNYEFLQAYDEAKERIDDEGKRNEN